jgi:membrane associated rhomboid family serine protease
MIIPIGHDKTTVERMPWVSITIIGVNVFVFLFSLLGIDPHSVFIDFTSIFCPDPLHAPTVLMFLIYGIDGIIRTFMHADFMHIFGNMLFFYLTGPFLENVYGRPLFLGFYLLSGLAAAAASVIRFWSMTGWIVLGIGASGAIAGLMGAFLVRFAGARIHFFCWFYAFPPGRFSASAATMLPLWFLTQLSDFHFYSLRTNIDFLAHIGGFIFGFLAALCIREMKIEEKFIRPRLERKDSCRLHPKFQEALENLGNGRRRDAVSGLLEAAKAEPENPDIHSEIAEIARRTGDGVLAERHGARAVKLYLEAGMLDAAYSDFSKTVERCGGIHLPARTLLELGERLEKSRKTEESIGVLTYMAEKYPYEHETFQGLVLLGRLYLEKRKNLGLAEKYLKMARSHPGGKPGLMDQIDDWLSRCRPPENHAARNSMLTAAILESRSPKPPAEAAPKPKNGHGGNNGLVRYPGSILGVEKDGLAVRMENRTGTVKWAYILISGAYQDKVGEGTRWVLDLAVARSAAAKPFVLSLAAGALHSLPGLESESPAAALRKLIRVFEKNTTCDILPSAGDWDRPRVPVFPNETLFREAFVLALGHSRRRNGRGSSRLQERSCGSIPVEGWAR